LEFLCLLLQLHLIAITAKALLNATGAVASANRITYGAWRIHAALLKDLKMLVGIHWINTGTTAVVLGDPFTPISLSQPSTISYPY